MSILHFFNHLRVRQLIGQIPFDADSLLQKTVLKHHNRSVAQEVTEEIFSKLYAFPEDVSASMGYRVTDQRGVYPERERLLHTGR